MKKLLFITSLLFLSTLAFSSWGPESYGNLVITPVMPQTGIPNSIPKNTSGLPSTFVFKLTNNTAQTVEYYIQILPVNDPGQVVTYGYEFSDCTSFTPKEQPYAVPAKLNPSQSCYFTIDVQTPNVTPNKNYYIFSLYDNSVISSEKFVVNVAIE